MKIDSFPKSKAMLESMHPGCTVKELFVTSEDGDAVPMTAEFDLELSEIIRDAVPVSAEELGGSSK